MCFTPTGVIRQVGTGTRRRSPLRSQPKARSDTPKGWGAGVPQSAGTARGVGETRYLQTTPPTDRWVSPDPASPAGPVPAPRPVLLMCGYHAHVGSYAILLSPPSGSRLITIYHAPLRVRRRSLRYTREERAALPCQPAGVADGLRPQPGRGEYPGESRAKCYSHSCEKVLAVLPGAERTSPEDLLHSARVLLWVRWFGLTAAFVEIHYRVDYGSLSHVLNTFYCLGFLAANGYVQWLIRRRVTVKPSWLFALSALDLAAISFSTSLSGGFNSPLLPGVLLRGGGVRLRVHLSPAGPALDDAGGGHLLGAERCR